MSQKLKRKEYIDLVDKFNRVVGITDVDTAHKLKQYHRVVGVFLFTNNKKLYLQKHEKYNLYDVSVGGHVKKNESTDDAIIRELKEELNITIPVIKIKTFLAKNSNLNHIWTIYIGYLPKNWVFNETNEVKQIKKMELREWINLIKKNPKKFTKGLLNTIGEILEYCDSVDKK